MKRVDIDRYGAPEDVARCVEVADVGAPGAGEVVFDVLYFPINPADVSFCRGTYRLRPPLPATPGAECVGRVSAVGAGLIGGGQKLVGFILGRGLATRTLDQVRVMYGELAHQLRDGYLSAPVEKVYAIEEIKAALAHAQRGERSGKILVAPHR